MEGRDRTITWKFTGQLVWSTQHGRNSRTDRACFDKVEGENLRWFFSNLHTYAVALLFLYPHLNTNDKSTLGEVYVHSNIYENIHTLFTSHNSHFIPRRKTFKRQVIASHGSPVGELVPGLCPSYLSRPASLWSQTSSSFLGYTPNLFCQCLRTNLDPALSQLFLRLHNPTQM